MTRDPLEQLEALYAAHCRGQRAIALHLPVLRSLASECNYAVEYGVNRGGSTTALLLGARRVISLDIHLVPAYPQLKQLASDRWTFLVADSTTYDLPPCDLLFLDANHTYASVKAELQYAGRVKKYLAFHDVTTFGEIGAAGETGAWLWTPSHPGESVPQEAWGIRPAIDELMIEDPSWRIHYRAVESHGFLVLAREGR